MKTAKIVEVFKSVQGEGLYLGQPATFVRFAGCNLCCDYCDTAYARDASRATEKNVDDVMKTIVQLAQPGEWVSLTGGEPLLSADFIAAIGPELRNRGLRMYLETNGTLPNELSKMVGLVEVVSMDIKPPSACGRDLWAIQREFLGIAGPKAMVKLVVAGNTLVDELDRAVGLVAAVDREIPLVLQPAHSGKAPDMQRMRAWQAVALRRLRQVWIIPQMHQAWNVR